MLSNSVWKVEKYQVGTQKPTNRKEDERIRDFLINRDGRPYTIEFDFYKTKTSVIKPDDECYSGAVLEHQDFDCERMLKKITGAPHYSEINGSGLYQVLPLKVDVCLYGGMLFSIDEAEACSQEINHLLRKNHLPFEATWTAGLAFYAVEVSCEIPTTPPRRSGHE